MQIISASLPQIIRKTIIRLFKGDERIMDNRIVIRRVLHTGRRAGSKTGEKEKDTGNERKDHGNEQDIV